MKKVLIVLAVLFLAATVFFVAKKSKASATLNSANNQVAVLRGEIAKKDLRLRELGSNIQKQQFDVEINQKDMAKLEQHGIPPHQNPKWEAAAKLHEKNVMALNDFKNQFNQQQGAKKKDEQDLAQKTKDLESQIEENKKNNLSIWISLLGTIITSLTTILIEIIKKKR